MAGEICHLIATSEFTIVLTTGEMFEITQDVTTHKIIVAKRLP